MKYNQKQEENSDRNSKELNIGEVEEKLEQWKDLYNGTSKSNSD